MIEGERRADGRRRGARRRASYDRSRARVILATGSVPRAIPGVEFGGRVIGTEEAWALQELPARLAVVGAGASGAEIASGFARLGSEVILLEALERVLPSEDADISRLVERGLKRQGIAVHTGTPIGDVQASENGVHFAYGEERARGRLPRDRRGPRPPTSRDSGSRRPAIELDERGLVKVDGAQRTSRAGRLRDRRPRPRPGARAQGIRRGHHRREDSPGLPTHPIAYVDIPRATFCTPNVGSFGLTEEQAREQGYDVVVGKVPYGAVGGGTVYGDRTGLVKIVGETQLRRAARRPHRRLARDRADPGARQRAGARGRLPRGRAHHPRPPDAVGGGDGGRPRRRRLADPRLRADRSMPATAQPSTSTSPARSPTSPPSRRSRSLRLRRSRVEWQPGAARASCPAPRASKRRAARPSGRCSARRSSAAPRELGLQPLRWPEPFPFDSALAMRVATYAKSIGRTVPFAQAAFRQAFAGGRALDDEDSVLIAAAACEMHPAAVLAGAALRSVAEQLDNGDRAGGCRGVRATCRRCWRRGACSTASALCPRRSRRSAPPGRSLRTAEPGWRSTRADEGKAAYRLIVTRGGRAPALLADPSGSITSSSSRSTAAKRSLFWDRPPHAASQLARALRADLDQPRRGGVPRALEYRGGLMAAASPRALPAAGGARVAGDDDADPPLRGARRRDVRARQDRRLPAPLDRRGGDDRRQRARAARQRLPDLDLPLPRPRAGPRHAAGERDGRAVRPRRRLLPRARRLDAHVRPRAALHGRLRDRRRQPADRRRHRAGQRLPGRDEVTLCTFGDGASNQGTFGETLNLAALWRLPVVFMVTNNQFGMGTALGRHSAVTDLQRKGESLGVPGMRCDGMDVLDTHAVVARGGRAGARGAPPAARSRPSPTASAATRWPTRSSTARKEEVAHWRERDPIPAFGALLDRRGRARRGRAASRSTPQALARVDAAVEFAEASPFPAPESLYDDVYVLGDEVARLLLGRDDRGASRRTAERPSGRRRLAQRRDRPAADRARSRPARKAAEHRRSPAPDGRDALPRGAQRGAARGAARATSA